ncbi:MAG: tyrosine-type recombinase/integrase [Halobacteriota archaeon]
MKNITDYLEKEQVDRVLAAAHQCSQRDYFMLRVLWRTGVRVNELLTITPRDIEPNNSVVNVTKAKGGKHRHEGAGITFCDVRYDLELGALLSGERRDT